MHYVRPFAVDKENFFKNIPKEPNQIKKEALNHSHSFLERNSISIEQEFIDLQKALLENNDPEQKDLWFYCYYCCIMLSVYYDEEHYNSSGQHQKYVDLAQQIEKYLVSGVYPKEKILTWKVQLYNDIHDLLSTPLHLSKIRNWLGFANAYRIAFTFSRLTNQAFFNALSQVFNLPLDIDELHKRINQTTAVFRALSVGLFLARLLVNTSLIIKHTFFPTSGEAELGMSQRFYQEITKRYPQLLNDLVWALINGLTNYAEFFKIPGSTANTLLCIFLVFDMVLLTYRMHAAEQNLTLQLSQYLREQTLLLKSSGKAQQRLEYLNQQITSLRIKIETTRYNFNTNIAAATIIFFGFSTSLLVTMPLLLCASYFTIVLGTALYLSADAYSEYKEKQLVEENLKFIGKNTQTAKANTQAAWHKFATTITKNTVMPIIIMATLAVCWQAALALIILSIAYEYATKYYQTHQNHGGGAIENAQFAP